jgi:AraC-like DNA-binding protein
MNRFRIEHFLELLQREGTVEYGIHVLAMRSGFLSKATFIKAFRKEMGMNPGAFAKSLTSGKDITGGGSTGS